MKMLMKLAMVGTMFGLAANYGMPMMNRKTKKRMKKQAKMLQGMMGSMFNNLVGALR